MIDPSNVTNPARTAAELEEFLLFCVVVAGKNADQQAREARTVPRGQEALRLHPGERPGRHARGAAQGGAPREVHAPRPELPRARRARAPTCAACGVGGPHPLPGIGIKTAKFFVLHSRRDEMHGVLDTHVLGWMRDHWAPAGARPAAVPRHSPQDPRELPVLGDGLLRDGGGPAPPGPGRGRRRLGAIRPRPLEGEARAAPAPA